MKQLRSLFLRRWWVWTLVAVIAVLFGIPAVRIHYYVEKVREFCASEAGVHVYEKVAISAARWDRVRGPDIPDRSLARGSDPYYYEMKNDPIVGKVDGHALAVWRTATRVYRAADGKLLGEEVAYSRRGGDP